MLLHRRRFVLNLVIVTYIFKNFADVELLELRDTEDAHSKAAVELEKLREDMERMEDEREQMVAEVEAQIERALASMMIDDEDNIIYRSQSRPLSRHSRIASPEAARSRSAPGSRRPSFTAADLIPHPRDSYTTEGSTIADHSDLAREKRSTLDETIEEEEIPARSKEAIKKSKQFDDMDPLDATLSEKNDRIAQKVLQIQQKVYIGSSRLILCSNFSF